MRVAQLIRDDPEIPTEAPPVLVSILIILLVWVPTITNCVYFALSGWPILVLYYIFVSQLFIIGRHYRKMRSDSRLNLQLEALVGQTVFFTVYVGQRNNWGYLYLLKEVMLIVTVVLTVTYVRQVWDAFSIVVLVINIIALVGDCWAITRVQETIEASVQFLTANIIARRLFISMLVILSYLSVALFAYVTYYINWRAFVFIFGMALLINFSIAMLLIFRY